VILKTWKKDPGGSIKLPIRNQDYSCLTNIRLWPTLYPQSLICSSQNPIPPRPWWAIRQNPNTSTRVSLTLRVTVRKGPMWTKPAALWMTQVMTPVGDWLNLMGVLWFTTGTLPVRSAQPYPLMKKTTPKLKHYA
jgi:hypothetical protein